MLEEEYVRRNTTQTQRNEILTDPRLVREDREGLEEYVNSEGLNSKHSSVEAQGRSAEGDRPGQSFSEASGKHALSTTNGPEPLLRTWSGKRATLLA